jgi:hypothetical protein
MKVEYVAVHEIHLREGNVNVVVAPGAKHAFDATEAERLLAIGAVREVAEAAEAEAAQTKTENKVGEETPPVKTEGGKNKKTKGKDLLG